MFESESPDLLVLDIMLPDGDGRSLSRDLQSGGRKVPTLFLSGLTEEDDIVMGFDSGGDAYLPKPYSLAVLIKNIEALLRLWENVPKVVNRGALTLRYNSAQVFVDGRDVMLSKLEFSLLHFLIQNDGEPLCTDYIYEEVWGRPVNKDDNAVRKAVNRLRTKLDGSGCIIATVHGKGYCFRLE